MFAFLAFIVWGVGRGWRSWGLGLLEAEATLERLPGEAWGLAWNKVAYAQQRRGARARDPLASTAFHATRGMRAFCSVEQIDLLTCWTFWFSLIGNHFLVMVPKGDHLLVPGPLGN